MEIDYTLQTKKSFDEAVESVEAETGRAGFRVLYVHDVKETLSKKNFIIDTLKIIEICNAKNAYTAIQKDINLALCLPCKINVYVKNGKTYISGMKPVIMKEIFINIDDLVDDVEKAIHTIVDNAK